MNVSRQIIVGDVALLRAGGSAIIATARGYMMNAPAPSGRFVGKIACRHNLNDTERELLAMVDMGAEVVDVVVTHHLYGDMTGRLNLVTRGDVYEFMNKVKNGGERLLSELTNGVHLHTLACRDKAAFDAVAARLKDMGLLYASEL
jgi:transcriptional regulator of NAD metabolism